MVRLASDPRTDDDKPLRMTWDGTEATARKIISWSIAADLSLRFSYNPRLPDNTARTFVERPYPESPSWEPTPVGSVIELAGKTQDAPLIVHLPEDPIAILEEK